MSSPEQWLTAVSDSPIYPWLSEQARQTEKILSAHGDAPAWQQTLQQLTQFSTTEFDFSQPAIKIGSADEISTTQRKLLLTLLQNYHPWRKGPFALFGTLIDSEWRSDLKWQRLANSITPLHGRNVLDVGCGNGYFMLRMLGAGATWVLGVDPTILFNMQFAAMKQLINKEINAGILPIGVDQVPDNIAFFDTVFSMGILYHRRSPIDHLYKLFNCLRPGGELVLETLVIEGPKDRLLLPAKRYAKMRNVWFIPAAAGLQMWLQRCGFIDIQLVDVSVTRMQEQRSTEWMRFESLKDFLDPDDLTKTIEGYPAPTRALLVARRPG